ncbi:MAG: TIGR03016 family PEP-CTERM system-associated outer membrane protein, partial [Chromatiales bacterium]
ERFYLDGWASADLTTITSTGRTGLGGLTGLADSTEVYTAGLSPYFKTRLGNVSLFEARYTLDNISYSEEGLDDSTGQRGDLVLGSGPAFTNQVWELSAMHNQVDYDALEEDNEVSQFRAEYAHQLMRQLAIAVAAGYEEYDLALNEDVDDSLWSAGIIYTPNSRTRLAIGGGERSFGDDYYLDFSHRTQRTIWTASYERDYTSARGELLRPTLFQRQDAFGNLVRDAVLESPLRIDRSSAPSPTISAEFYVLERFVTNFTLATGRTTLDLGGSHAERDYVDDADDTKDVRLSGRLTRAVSPQTSVYFSLSGTNHEEEELDYDQLVSALGGSYMLGVNTTLGMRLAHLERDADIETESYEENSFSIYLTALF